MAIKNNSHETVHEKHETLLIPGVLENVAKMYRDGEINKNIQPALNNLLGDAEVALNTPFYSVMDKEIVPPNGTKHDYMSLSIYTWPDPDKPDGLPYRIRDGVVNPEVQNYDRPNMAKMIHAVNTLSYAYFITGDEKYAKKAADLIKVWFLNPETAMNPNMLFAQYIPGDGDFDIPKSYYPVYVPGKDRKGVYVSFGGVIEGAILPIFLESVGLLQDSESWLPNDHSRLQKWFSEFLHWLLESQHGKDEASTKNNHGSWYCTQVVSYAIFSGEYDIAKRILNENVPERIVMQIEPDGSQPSELERAISFDYVVFGLTSFFNLALLGERVGINLWNYRADNGAGLKKAIDWIMPYLEGNKKWPYPLLNPINYTRIVPLLHMAARAYGDPKYAEVIDNFPNYQIGNKFRLLYF